MREFQNQYDYESSKSNDEITNQLKIFVLKPIIIGLFTFSIFFTTILVTKIITYLFNEFAVFSLNIYDVLFALIGFGIGFCFELVINVRRKFFRFKIK